MRWQPFFIPIAPISLWSHVSLHTIHSESLIIDRYLVTVEKLSTATVFHLAVHLHLTRLDADFGLPSPLDSVGKFQELVQPDEICVDPDVNHVSQRLLNRECAPDISN